MNLKKKFRAFFTLTRKADGGFTLVELIVVIAILAILSGVAVPAYSGYVEKAKRAADEQLLSAVNKAFASACIANGSDIYLVDSASAPLVDGTVDGENVSPYGEQFVVFFEGNENAKFQVFDAIIFDETIHHFVEGVSITYAGKTLVVNKENVAAVLASTWLQQDSLGGTDGLLNKVADVANFAQTLYGQSGNAANLLNGVISSPGFLAFAADALGLDPTDTNAFATKHDEIIAAMKASNNPAYEGKTDDELEKIFMTNAAVLYAADSATKMSKEDIIASLTISGEQGVKNNIIETMGTDTTAAFSQATMAFGMYTAWAHATDNQEAMAKDELDVMNDLNNADFQNWLKNDPQAQKDLDGYLAALEIVNSSSKDADAVTSLVTNGFGDSNLQGAIGDLFG